MERFDVTSRLLLQIGPGGPEQTISLAIRQPPVAFLITPV